MEGRGTGRRGRGGRGAAGSPDGRGRGGGPPPGYGGYAAYGDLSASANVFVPGGGGGYPGADAFSMQAMGQALPGGMMPGMMPPQMGQPGMMMQLSLIHI